LCVGRQTTGYIREHNRRSWVRVALDNLIVSIVGVAMQWEANDILEAFHQGAVPRAELMLALIKGIVGDKKCYTSLRFDFEELLL